MKYKYVVVDRFGYIVPAWVFGEQNLRQLIDQNQVELIKLAKLVDREDKTD